jgi:hypothetical protein
MLILPDRNKSLIKKILVTITCCKLACSLGYKCSVCTNEGKVSMCSKKETSQFGNRDFDVYLYLCHPLLIPRNIYCSFISFQIPWWPVEKDF